MASKVAAIKSGTDPVAKLPEAGFHRTLEEPVVCPLCDTAYNLVVDYDWAVSRYFADEIRPHLMLLRKTIKRGHDYGHRVTHFETNGVVVTAHAKDGARELPTKPLTTLIQ